MLQGVISPRCQMSSVQCEVVVEVHLFVMRSSRLSTSLTWFLKLPSKTGLPGPSLLTNHEAAFSHFTWSRPPCTLHFLNHLFPHSQGTTFPCLCLSWPVASSLSVPQSLSLPPSSFLRCLLQSRGLTCHPHAQDTHIIPLPAHTLFLNFNIAHPDPPICM